MLRIGIVGFGKMGVMHGALLQAMDGVDLAAITDTSKFMLSGFKSLFPQVKTYQSYRKMIDECGLDAVIIATPSFNHVEIAQYALARNIHLFVEKPLSNDVQSGRELLKTAAESSAIAMVGFCMRYNPMFAEAKRWIDEGKLGTIQQASASIYCSDVLSEQSGWRFDPKQSGGGVLIDFAVHMLDMLYYYFGEVEEVSGRTNAVYSKVVEDEVRAELIFGSGATGTLHGSWSRPEYRKPFYQLEAVGSLGSLKVTDQEIRLEQASGVVISYYPDLYQGSYIDIGGPHFSKQMELFISSVRDNSVPEANLASGLYVQTLIDAIYRSARHQGEAQKVKVGSADEY